MHECRAQERKMWGMFTLQERRLWQVHLLSRYEKVWWARSKKKCCLERHCTSLIPTANGHTPDAVGKQEPSTNFYKPSYLLEQRRKAYHIAKDGNCLYRAVSYSITGDQDHYASLKLLLERFENLNSEIFSGLLLSVNKRTMRTPETYRNA